MTTAQGFMTRRLHAGIVLTLEKNNPDFLTKVK